VDEMNWRETWVVTRENIPVRIPNSKVADAHIRNLSRPEGPRRARDYHRTVLRRRLAGPRATQEHPPRGVPPAVATREAPEARQAEGEEHGRGRGDPGPQVRLHVRGDHLAGGEEDRSEQHEVGHAPEGAAAQGPPA